jgi:alanine racemase
VRRALIDIRALQHNVRCIRKLAPKTAILAMVKSNAYGHGLIVIAKSLTEVDGFGVACLDEAIKLHEAGITKPIVLMHGFFSHSDLSRIVEHGFQVIVHERFQVEMLERAKLAKPIHVWLKIDTGMHRLGFTSKAVLGIYQRLMNCCNVISPIILITHLASANDLSKTTTQAQLKQFFATTNNLSSPRSIANSAGIIAWPDSHCEWVRPGIMLYGISPMVGGLGEHHGLQPVMTLSSKLIAIHDLQSGDAIGYGGIWQCPENMRVGVVAIGYGDGYPRHARNGTPVLINGTLCPLVGRVSMDMITVDLRPCPHAKITDDVILWGRGLPAETVAQYADTIAYELLCHVSERVTFIVTD